MLGGRLFSRLLFLVWLSACIMLPMGAQAAGAGGEDASLARGATPDTTAGQRYQSAVREAGGGLKLSIAECRSGDAASRSACESEARKRYREEMDAAKALLHPPGVRSAKPQPGPNKEPEPRIVGKPLP
ncbi:hypothetical protein [Paracidovorax cattleyae]|uniref:hypothetical protein n=1 Tax=Paracidovorax cattleyae TaxID=80868 RepID=UPI001A126108|nr:hypothetical protein [Paracidovorax cattleyae]MBF9263215.1 hypothetical protein [Paracidovorax cattleyae]